MGGAPDVSRRLCIGLILGRGTPPGTQGVQPRVTKFSEACLARGCRPILVRDFLGVCLVCPSWCDPRRAGGGASGKHVPSLDFAARRADPGSPRGWGCWASGLGLLYVAGVPQGFKSDEARFDFLLRTSSDGYFLQENTNNFCRTERPAAQAPHRRPPGRGHRVDARVGFSVRLLSKLGGRCWGSAEISAGTHSVTSSAAAQRARARAGFFGARFQTPTALTLPGSSECGRSAPCTLGGFPQRLQTRLRGLPPPPLLSRAPAFPQALAWCCAPLAR